MRNRLLLRGGVPAWALFLFYVAASAESLEMELAAEQRTDKVTGDSPIVVSEPNVETKPDDAAPGELESDVHRQQNAMREQPVQNNQDSQAPDRAAEDPVMQADVAEVALRKTEAQSNSLSSPVNLTPQGRKEITIESTPLTDPTWPALELLGNIIQPNQRSEIRWTTGQSFDGSEIKTPITVIRGASPGPTLCLTAAVHGDEVNGVEVVRRVLSEISSEDLSGSVIGAPIVNMLGFARGSRYLPDRRDLNRYFPGQPNGSFASRIAYVFFNEIVRHCDALVDFHTGSFKRTNLPQLRADLSIPPVKAFVENFGATAVLNKSAASGTLRGAATSAGIPAVAFELGGPVTLQLESVEFGVKAIDTLLDKLGMIQRFRLWSEPQPVFYRSRWLRAHRGGILSSSLTLGGTLKKNDLLGWVTNPITNERSEIRSPFDGRLLGRALNQFVLPGFAVFHIGIEASEKDELVDDDTTDGARTLELECGSGSDIVVEDFPDDNETH